MDKQHKGLQGGICVCVCFVHVMFSGNALHSCSGNICAGFSCGSEIRSHRLALDDLNNKDKYTLSLKQLHRSKVKTLGSQLKCSFYVFNQCYYSELTLILMGFYFRIEILHVYFCIGVSSFHIFMTLSFLNYFISLNTSHL